MSEIVERRALEMALSARQNSSSIVTLVLRPSIAIERLRIAEGVIRKTEGTRRSCARWRATPREAPPSAPRGRLVAKRLWGTMDLATDPQTTMRPQNSRLYEGTSLTLFVSCWSVFALTTSAAWQACRECNRRTRFRTSRSGIKFSASSRFSYFLEATLASIRRIASWTEVNRPSMRLAFWASKYTPRRTIL